MSRGKSNAIILAVVFWPWAFIGIEFAILAFVTALGCEISATGPRECILFGRDYGEALYPLWSLGYQIAFSLLYVFPVGLFFGILVTFFEKGND